MSKKIEVEPWFGNLVSGRTAEIFIRDLMQLRKDVYLGASDLNAPEYLQALGATHLNELLGNWKKYVDAAMHGYEVKEPRKAFQLLNGDYIHSISVHKYNVTASTYCLDFQTFVESKPAWLGRSDLDAIQLLAAGEIVKEGEEK